MTVGPAPSKELFVSMNMLRAAAAALAGTLVLTACGSGGEEEATSGGDSSASATGADTVVEMVPVEDRELADDQNIQIRNYSEPVGFDPATLFRIDTEVIALQIYEGLTSFDPLTGEPTPGLAESWDISEDGLTYTFELVENASFHHGYGPLTSKDVVYSYERIRDPATGSPYRQDMANIVSIEAPDDYTVVITLEKPEANFLLQVTNNHQGQIVNQRAVEEFGADYPRNPVGTGPFYLDSWTAQSSLVLKRFDEYHQGPASLESATFELITDSAATETAIINGEVDAAFGTQNLSSEQYDRVAGTEDVTIATSWANYALNWLFGPDFEPFEDAQVRRAFVMAIDMEAIAETVAPYALQPGTSLVPPWMEEYDDSIEPIPYDPEGAKKLLAEAGYPDGFTVKVITALKPTETAVLQQDFLSQVGIDMQFDVVEPPVFNERRQTGNHELSFRGYPAINIDTLLSGYLHSDYSAPNGFNSQKINDPELDGMLEAARAELDDDARTEIYHEIQQYLADQVIYPAYGYSPQSIAHKDEIMNIQPNRLATFSLYPVYRSAE